MHSKWATQIVPVPKKDGKVRICGDYDYQAIDADQYPLPCPINLFATLAKVKSFPKLDHSQAYIPESAQYSITYYNTHALIYLPPVGMAISTNHFPWMKSFKG